MTLVAGTDHGIPPRADAADRRQPVPWRKRGDLIIRQQDSGAWIVKDPLSLSYSLLNEQEMAILRMLDGSKSFSDLLRLLQAAWPQESFEREDITELLSQLVHNQLVVATSVHRPSGRSVSSPANPIKLLFGLTRLLRIRFRLLNPTQLLEKLHPLAMLMFSRGAAVVFSLLLLIAAILAILRFDQLISSLPGPRDFFGPDNMLLLLISFVFVKTMHEVGHALAARRFGAECHEAGVMLLLLTPLLYTNVTDAWILNRRSRLIITAAGMLMELALASIAMVLWFAAAPGLMKALLANVMILCTVGTVLFNANPLLRFDGYFLLIDAVGEPNLAQRAAARIQTMTEDLLLGKVTHQNHHSGWFVPVYGICAGIYRFILTAAILVMLYNFFDQWNLHVAGVALMSVAAVSMVIAPLIHTAGGVVVALFHRPNRIRRAVRASIILLIVIGSLFVPLPHSILVPAVVEPAGVPVFATLSGEFSSSAEYGASVSPGEAIAVLQNIPLRRELVRIAGDVRTQEARIRALELNRSGNSAAGIPEAKSILETAQQRLQQYESELERLIVRSPMRGILLPPRSVPLSDDEQSLSGRPGHPLDPRNHGCRIEDGTLLGYVCDPLETEILMTLTNDQRQMIRSGQDANFQSSGNPVRVLGGSVKRMASLEIREIPVELTAAGLVAPLAAARPGEDTRRWQAVFTAVVPADGIRPPLYSTGFVRVHVESVSLAGRLSRFLAEAFD